VVWNGNSEAGNIDIYFCEYDRVTGSCPPQRLTGHATWQGSPAIDGDRIVFQDDRKGRSEIVTFELPSLDPIGDRAVAEGDDLRIPIEARDPAGDPLEFDARLANGEALETIGARFRVLGRRRAELRWSPGYDRAGSYAITFTATTSGRLHTGETIRIEVLDANAPPVALAGRSRIAVAWTRLNGCRSFDPEGEPLSYVWNDASGRELGTSCRLRLQGPSVPRLESYTLTVSDGTYSDSDRVWILWIPRLALRWR
jgi:beta propeller repeat protein